MAWDVAADRKAWEYGDRNGDTIFGNPRFSRDGKLIVVPAGEIHSAPGSRPKTLYTELLVLDGKTGKKVRSIKPEGAGDINAVIDDKGQRIALLVEKPVDGQDAEFELLLHHLATGDRVFAVDIDDPSPLLTGFTPDGKELMVAQRDSGGLLVLDAATGTRRRIIAPEGTVLNPYGEWSLSPDGRTLAVHGFLDQENLAVALYDAATGEPQLRIPLATWYRPLAMDWSPDGRRLVLGSSQGASTQVTVFDTRTGRLLLSRTRKGLSSSFRCALHFSGDNQRLMHIASDNRAERGELENPSTHPIHIWDGTPVAEFTEQGARVDRRGLRK